ncbi:MAG TPA: DUF4335 domain-containing protein, partial [Thermosynechococcaceae cyanobacterium]
MSYSVLRRYTPPTCALEILAKNSPLSRWAGQTVLKDVRFNLSLDDPKLPPDQWVTLRGDRSQLEALQETVQRYVQNLLEQSHDRLNAAFSPQTLPQTATSVASLEPVGLSNAAGISLSPKGLLTHNLNLGALQTDRSGATLSLTTLQLFDLANALEDYATDVLTLPTAGRSNWLTASPAWAKIAAMAVLVLGVSASIVKVLDAPYSPSTASSPSSSQGASSSDQRIANQLPPSVPRQTPSPLATTKPLTSPPPPIDSTLPSTGLPVNPGFPTTTGSQNTPATSGDTVVQNGQPESTVVVPGNPTPREPDRQAAPPLVAEIPSPDRSDSPASSSSAAESRSAAAAPADAGTESAFDIIPQVAEVKRYFVQNWSPPKDLTQTLEYVVSVDASGTVQAVSPLGGPSQTYLPKTGIPKVGEPLVSP